MRGLSVRAAALTGLFALSCDRAGEQGGDERGEVAGSHEVTVTTAVAEVLDPGVRTDAGGSSTWVGQVVRTSVGGG